MSENRLSNLIKDLSKAKQQALLIEVLQSDLESLSGQNDDAFKTVCNSSAKVFDVGVKSGKTNVLMVGEAQDQAPLSIFGALLNSLDEEFDDLHKRAILEKLTGFGLSQALGGGVGDAVSESLSVGAEKMMEYLTEWTGSASDFIASAFETGVETAAEQSGDLLETAGETGAEAVTGYFSSDNEMYLSRPARKRLKELAPRLSEQTTSHETLQLALEMLLVSAQGAPKVIVVKDPLQLDEASLALLAMLVSVEKDLRQLNHNEEADQGRAQTAGISVVLTFTGPQPHDSVENNVTEKKLRAISRLRMMASRYSLLERLDSDIPVPAVRASTFVGRESELNSLWKDWNRICTSSGGEGVQTWALIKGEPGTGKTALANRFTQQVHSDTGNPGRFGIPILRMLNQTGHSAQATGLASLKNSIVDELRRLNLIYEENVGWFARTGQKLKEEVETLASESRSDDPEAKKRVRAKLGRMISRLVGVDSAMEVARSAKSWSDQDEIRSMSEQRFGESSQANHKEEQYELLRLALNEIRKLALKCTQEIEGQPTDYSSQLILLIDDLQWVDDFTAEFLLNEWPADLPVYIIATARGSDSFAAAMGSGTYTAMNRNRDQLFAELGLIDAAPLSQNPKDEEETEQKKNKVQRESKAVLSLASQVVLKGMDQPMLANLIYLSYGGVTVEQAEKFAEGIILNLAGENRAEDVITLFAVETLNVISDPQFYRRNPDLPRLIEPMEGPNRYRLRAPENTSLAEALDCIFRSLTETYQTSYLVEAGHGGRRARFNLASYAVLEERLHLIEQYFGENGGTVRYSLLFSALLGSPFHGGLVQHILKDLGQLSPEENPELGPFLEELRKQACGNLEPAQYEILEQAYEIIRRLGESITTVSRYVHQHGLLQHYLRGQLTQLLNGLYPESRDFEVGIRSLVSQVEARGKQWFEEQEVAAPLHRTDDGEIEIEKYRLMVALSGFWYAQMKVRTPEVGEWAKCYALRLGGLASELDKWGRPEEALPLYQEVLSIHRQGHESSPERWADCYATTLNNLALILGTLGRPEESLPLLQEALTILRRGYDSSPECWGENYASSLTNLASTLGKLGRQEESLLLLQEALTIHRRGYESSPERWARVYVCSLNNLAGIFGTLGHLEESLLLLQEALSIHRKGHDSSLERWREDYASSLNNLAFTLDQLGRPEDALPLLQEALSIRRKGHNSSPERWAEGLAISLNNLAGTLDRFGRFEESLLLKRESLSICRHGYESAPGRWEEEYAISLRNLAFTLNQLSRPKEALPLLQEALSVCRHAYESSPKRWSESLATSLNNLAGPLGKLSRMKEALPLLQEALSICRQGHESTPERWIEGLATSLNNLAFTLDQLGRPEESLPLYQEALTIHRESYGSSPERWADGLATSLKNLALNLETLGRGEESLPLYQEALSVCRHAYESSPKRWAERLATSLGNLAATLYKLGRPEEALPLYEEALSFHRQGYDSSVGDGAEDYVTSLNNLALTLDKLGRLEEALPVYQEAVSIHRQVYQLSPERWAAAAARNLNNLAATFYRLGRLEEALPLIQEALSICRQGYDSSPEVWRENYVSSLDNLASTLDKLGRAKEAIRLQEEAQAVRLSHTQLEENLNIYKNSEDKTMSKPDPRIPAMLELAELKFRIDDDGDAIVMISGWEEDRSQTVFISSRTYT